MSFLKELSNREIKYPQKSKEWLNARKSLITASNASLLLPRRYDILDCYKPYSKIEEYVDPKVMCDPFGDTYTFFSKKIKQNTFVGSKATVFGEKYENIILDYYKRIKKQVVHEFSLIIDSELPFLGASPDGVTESGNLVEIKAPYSRKIIKGHVPLKYYIQVQIQLKVTNLELCDYIEFSFIEYIDIEEFSKNTKESDFRGLVVEMCYTETPKSFQFVSFYNETLDYTIINAFLENFQNSKTLFNISFFVLKESNIVGIKKDQDFLNIVLPILSENAIILEEIIKDPNLLETRYSRKLEFLKDSDEE